MSGPKPSAPWQ
jgi:hypothetical protein